MKIVRKMHLNQQKGKARNSAN